MIIRLTDIGKKYGNHWIFRHVEAVFEPGGIYPVIGSNGSGKSTLLQIISGYVTPNSGSIAYESEGTRIQTEEWYKMLAIAAPYLDLFDEFTVEESIALHRKLKPLTIDSDDEMMAAIELDKHRNKTLQQLSSGMRQRLKLALALYSSSEVLLLDEPCSNLDQRWKGWFNDALKQGEGSRITIICSNSQEDELKHSNGPALDLIDPLYR